MVKFEVKFNSNLTKQASKFSFKRLGWLMVCIAAVFILAGLVGIFLGSDEEDKLLGYILVAIGILYIPLTWLVVKIIQHFANKNNPSLHMNMTQVFMFDENGFHISELSEGLYQSQTTAKYAVLYRAYETKTHFMLYISGQQVYVIPKESLTEGTTDELTDYLRRSLQTQFHQK